MVPGRRDPLFTEDGIRKAIQGNLEAIEAGLRPVLIARRPYVPYKKHPKYTRFMALYVHYLYLLGKIKKREYPPKMTPHLKAEIMKFEKYKAQFKFLHENHITGPEQLAAHRAACEDSQKLSEDVKWGFRKSFAQGKAYFGGRFYGYRMAGEGKVEIIPEQAEIVKQIFQMYLDGSTSRKIAQTLTRRGVLNASGNIRWDSTAIDRMLANEKYMGDALSQKTFIADVLEKKPQKNTGQLPQYYVTDNHEAIIPREMFKRVQFERARRSSLEPKGTKTKTNAGRFRPQYVLTEILLCGECGEHYRRCTWARNGKKKVVWRCINRLENGKRNCRESPTLDEGVLHDAILGFLRNLQSPRDELVQNLLEYTEEALEQKTGDSKKQKLLDMLEQKNRLLQEMLSLDIVPDEKIERLSREYDEIQEQIDSLGDVQNGMEQENAYIRGIKEYMETADFNRYEFDDKLIRQVIEQVIVKNADTLYIRMKGGYEAEIKLPNV